MSIEKTVACSLPILVVVFFLSACASQKSEPPSSTPAPTPAQTTKVSVGVDQSPRSSVAGVKAPAVTEASPVQSSDKVTAKSSVKAPVAPVKPPVVKAASTVPEKKAVTKKLVAQPVANASIKGQVNIVGKNGKAIVSNESFVILEPLGEISESAVQEKRSRHKINMINKTYTPGVITVKTHDTVEFWNGDALKHNVFSSSGENTFDLGSYGQDKTNEVAFNKPGIVKVYCNIHPDMATFIAVSDLGFSTITDRQGGFVVPGLPAGEYQLTVWNIRGQLKQKINLSSGEQKNITLQINAASYKKKQHKNKYGKDYDVQPSIFEDEIY